MQELRVFFFFMLLSVFFSTGSFAEAETIRNTNTGQANRSSNASGDPLAPFLGHPGRSGAVPNPPSGEDPLKAIVPAWSGRQEPSSESKLGWALWEMTQKTGEAAKTVKETVKTSITDYVKDKHKQLKQQDLIEKFYTNLQYVTQSLRLSPRDHQALTARVQRVYIEDAESGRYEFDSLHFRELPYIVRKEYADMVLERTENGEAETYHLNGELKTRWLLKNGQPEGPIVTYYENGEINFIDVFKDGHKIKRTKYDIEGKLVFEQNYEYSLPVQESLTPQADPAAEQEVAAVKEQVPADEPHQFAETQTAGAPEEVSPPQKTSATGEAEEFIELPPQILPNHIEV